MHQIRGIFRDSYLQKSVLHNCFKERNRYHNRFQARVEPTGIVVLRSGDQTRVWSLRSPCILLRVYIETEVIEAVCVISTRLKNVTGTCFCAGSSSSFLLTVSGRDDRRVSRLLS